MYVCILSIIGIILLLIIIIYKDKQNKTTNITKTTSEGFISSYGNSDIHTYENLTNNSDTPWTIDKYTKLKVIDIIKQILHNINKQTNMSYYFTTFDQLRHECIATNTNTHRFTADFFAHEMKTLITRRILLVFTVDYISNELNV